MDTLNQLQSIFRNVLNNNELNISSETTASDVEEWDSLSHIMLIVEIEKHFGKKFTTREIQQWMNVGDMVKSIEA